MSPKYKFVPDRDYILWQLPCSTEKAGMCYVIASADGRNFIIDGGGADNIDRLLTFLREKGLTEIAAWFITHPHRGHADALMAFLENRPADIKVSKIIHSHLSLDRIEKFEPESLEFVVRFNKLLKSCGIPTVSVNAGDRLKLGRTMIRVFSAGDGDYTEDYIDNTSAVYKFNMYCSSVLFLGDIRRDASIAMLEKYKSELNCDIVQMANHGLHGALSEVYALASPDICLWSTSKEYIQEDTPNGDVFWENRRLMEALGAGEHHVCVTDGISEIHITY